MNVHVSGSATGIAAAIAETMTTVVAATGAVAIALRHAPPVAASTLMTRMMTARLAGDTTQTTKTAASVDARRIGTAHESAAVRTGVIVLALMTATTGRSVRALVTVIGKSVKGRRHIATGHILLVGLHPPLLEFGVPTATRTSLENRPPRLHLHRTASPGWTGTLSVTTTLVSMSVRFPRRGQ